jgi:ParB-like chromosome segregation protein Spo0J
VSDHQILGKGHRSQEEAMDIRIYSGGATAMYENHPLAELFPLMPEQDFGELKADIAEAGKVFIPIVLYEGKVLDGRHRYRACNELGLESPTIEYTGTQPLKHIISLNERRRHLDLGQRAIIAAQVANMSWGGDRRSEQSSPGNFVRQDEAATQMGVSRDSVIRAKAVLDTGDTQLIEDVKTGKTKLKAAANHARQQKFIERYGTEEEKDVWRQGDATIGAVHAAILERQRLNVWSRVNAGETQKVIAQVLGLHQSQVSKLFSQARDLYGDTLVDKADELEAEPESPEPIDADEEETDDQEEDEPESLHLPLEPPETSVDEDPLGIPTNYTTRPQLVPVDVLSADNEQTYDPTRAYRRWLDVFQQHIALVGGLDDVGGMRVISAALGVSQIETMLAEILEIRDHWNRHVSVLQNVLQRSMINVTGG